MGEDDVETKPSPESGPVKWNKEDPLKPSSGISSGETPEGWKEVPDEPKGIHETEGLDKGRIIDVEAAREVAELEKPARAREAELKRQGETGLTDEQRINIELMKGLEEKYPDAFTISIDSKGRRIMRCVNVDFREQLFVITTEGSILTVTGDYPGDERAADFISKLKSKHSDSGNYLKNKGNRAYLRAMLRRTQIAAEKSKDQEPIKVAQRAASEMLKDLL